MTLQEKKLQDAVKKYLAKRRNPDGTFPPNMSGGLLRILRAHRTARRTSG